MEIERCPQCGRPRAVGHRCPSCGQAASVVSEKPTAAEQTESWRAEPTSWQDVPRPSGPSAGQTATTRPKGSSGGKKGGFLATAIVTVVVIAIVAVVAVVLTTGGAAVVEQEASLASTPDRAYDQAAQSLLRNAMTAMDAAFVESADYTAVKQSTLQAMEPAIIWMTGGGGISASPPAGANAQQNAVSFACTGRMSYELGTWSASGVEFGVKVNKAGGGTTYYKGGQAAGW